MSICPSPGKQRVDVRHRPAIDDLAEDVSDVGLRIEAVKLRGFDQRSQARPVDRARIVAGEQAVLAVSPPRPGA